jgi:hypothetical protein
MTCPRNPLSTRVRVQACLLAILALASTPLGASAQAATVGAAKSATPTFPTPASARVHTGAAGASTPTTTYVPSTSLPGAAAKGLPTSTTAGQPATALKSALNASARTRARSKPSGKLSTAAIVVAAVAALLALGCAAWGLARRRAFEPHWLLSLRHAMAEAGFRTSATWAEFADWARLGR